MPENIEFILNITLLKHVVLRLNDGKNKVNGTFQIERFV